MTTARRLRTRGTKLARIPRAQVTLIPGARVIQTRHGWQPIVDGHRIGDPCQDRMHAQTIAARALHGTAPSHDWWSDSWDLYHEAQTAYYEQQIWSDE